MSEIAQIIESNGARILSVYITDADDKHNKAHPKLNIIDIAPVIQTLDTNNVAASYNQSENKNNLGDRYDLLMRHLNPNATNLNFFNDNYSFYHLFTGGI